MSGTDSVAPTPTASIVTETKPRPRLPFEPPTPAPTVGLSKLEPEPALFVTPTGAPGFLKPPAPLTSDALPLTLGLRMFANGDATEKTAETSSFGLLLLALLLPVTAPSVVLLPSLMVILRLDLPENERGTGGEGEGGVRG